MHENRFNTVVIGGGPAGTGLLFNALKKRQHKEFLEKGIAFVDSTEDLACGNIGKYIINSDTEGKVFLECLAHAEKDLFESKELEKKIELIAQSATSSVPLEWIGEYLKLLGTGLKKLIKKYPSSRFFSQTTAVSVTKNKPGDFYIKIKTTCEGVEKEKCLRSHSVVFAMGGHQDREDIISRRLANELDLKNYNAKIILTDSLFTKQGIIIARDLLAKAKNKKVVIIGGSHSAFSAIGVLLNKMEGIVFEEHDITLMHRGKLKLFYPDKEAANNEGYYDFTDDDICPVTKKVHRLGGLRLDSGELLKKFLGMNREIEKRIKLWKICEEAEKKTALKNILDEAVLIIPAFGYRPRTIPVYENNYPLELFCKNGGPLVNKHCQVMDISGSVIKGLYGIGLASGFSPWGKMGGEPGFTGQTNGLWLYQNDVGGLIYDQLMEKKHK